MHAASFVLLLLAGLDSPSSGRVLIAGANLALLTRMAGPRFAGKHRGIRVSVLSP